MNTTGRRTSSITPSQSKMSAQFGDSNSDDPADARTGVDPHVVLGAKKPREDEKSVNMKARIFCILPVWMHLCTWQQGKESGSA